MPTIDCSFKDCRNVPEIQNQVREGYQTETYLADRCLHHLKRRKV